MTSRVSSNESNTELAAYVTQAKRTSSNSRQIELTERKLPILDSSPYPNDDDGKRYREWKDDEEDVEPLDSTSCHRST